MKEYPESYFDRKEILKKCEALEDLGEQIKYLKEVKHEYITEPPVMDVNLLIPNQMGLVEYLDLQIEYREDGIKNKPNLKFKDEYELKDLIWWKGSEPMLIYLFDLLLATNLIDETQYDNRFAMMSKHFKNKEAQSFDNKQMATAYKRMREDGIFKKPKVADSEKIENTIKEVRELLKNYR